MIKLLSIFDPTMLGPNVPSTIMEVSLVEAKQLLTEGFESFIQHESIASIFSTLLDVNVNVNHEHVTLNRKDHALLISMSFRFFVPNKFTKEDILNTPVRCFHIVNF